MTIRFFFAVALLCTSVARAEKPAPRIISCGWNAPTVGQFARDHADMPGDLPLTGCVLTLHADSGNPDPLATGHGRDDWSHLDVSRSIDAMAAIGTTSMPDNYLLLKANPGDVDWFDDPGWQTIVDHYRIAARLAHRAGLRGLLVDFEPYTEPHRQFQYSRQASATEHSFGDYRSVARRRGRQVMNAIASEFPDAEIATYFLLSYLIEDHHYRGPSPVGRGDSDWCLAGHSYGLLPAFVDGWLDDAPETMKLIDGCENAYWFTSEDQFRQTAQGVRDRGAQLVSAENRDKYLRQIEVAFPIYVDAMHPTLAGRYTLQPEQSDRLNLLRRNLSAAITHGDGLVWLYGEHGRWWPEAGEQALWNGKDTYPTWETQLPGISELLKSVAAEAVADSLDNVATEPTTKDKPIEDAVDSVASTGDDQIGATVIGEQPVWGTLQNDPIGQVVLGDGQVTITAARDAAGTATVATQPGRRYMIQVQVVQQGRGMTKLSIRWQTPDGQQWAGRKYEVVAYPGDGDPFQPRTITAIAQSPPEPHNLVVICHASQQLNDDDAALFGNLLIGLVDE